MFWGSRLLLFEAKTNVPTLLHKCLQFAASNKNIQNVNGSYSQSYSCCCKKRKETRLKAGEKKLKTVCIKWLKKVDCKRKKNTIQSSLTKRGIYKLIDGLSKSWERGERETERETERDRVRPNKDNPLNWWSLTISKKTTET